MRFLRWLFNRQPRPIVRPIRIEVPKGATMHLHGIETIDHLLITGGTVTQHSDASKIITELETEE